MDRGVDKLSDWFIDWGYLVLEIIYLDFLFVISFSTYVRPTNLKNALRYLIQIITAFEIIEVSSEFQV